MKRLALYSFSALLLTKTAIAKPMLEGNAGNYTVRDIFDYRPEQISEVLTDFNRLAEWAPDIKESKVLEQSKETLRVTQTYQAPYTFNLPIRAYLQIRPTAGGGFSYRLIKSQLIESLSGEWKLTRSGNKTVVIHSTRINAKVPSILLPVYYKLQEENLLAWMEGLKNRIKSKQ